MSGTESTDQTIKMLELQIAKRDMLINDYKDQIDIRVSRENILREQIELLKEKIKLMENKNAELTDKYEKKNKESKTQTRELTKKITDYRRILAFPIVPEINH